MAPRYGTTEEMYDALAEKAKVMLTEVGRG